MASFQKQITAINNFSVSEWVNSYRTTKIALEGIFLAVSISVELGDLRFVVLSSYRSALNI